jgi:hypothetical protein
VLTDDSGHSSRPSKPLVVQLGRLPSAGASHCGHRLLCLSSVWLVVPSPRFSRRHLPSASASASHRAIASSCHAHLGPLVRLAKASPHLFIPAIQLSNQCEIIYHISTNHYTPVHLIIYGCFRGDFLFTVEQSYFICTFY